MVSLLAFQGSGRRPQCGKRWRGSLNEMEMNLRWCAHCECWNCYSKSVEDIFRWAEVNSYRSSVVEEEDVILCGRKREIRDDKVGLLLD